MKITGLRRLGRHFRRHAAGAAFGRPRASAARPYGVSAIQHTPAGAAFGRPRASTARPYGVSHSAYACRGGLWPPTGERSSPLLAPTVSAFQHTPVGAAFGRSAGERSSPLRCVSHSAYACRGGLRPPAGESAARPYEDFPRIGLLGRTFDRSAPKFTDDTAGRLIRPGDGETAPYIWPRAFSS